MPPDRRAPYDPEERISRARSNLAQARARQPEVYLEDLPGRMREVVRLNQYAVAARYPGVDEPVEPDEYEEAVGLAGYAVEWVRAALSEGPSRAPGERPQAGSGH